MSEHVKQEEGKEGGGGRPHPKTEANVHAKDRERKNTRRLRPRKDVRIEVIRRRTVREADSGRPAPHLHTIARQDGADTTGHVGRQLELIHARNDTRREGMRALGDGERGR